MFQQIYHRRYELDQSLLNLSRHLLILSVCLAVPILPFLLLHEQIEIWLNAWINDAISATTAFWAIVVLLSSDILLPIPSSFISTMAGSILPVVPAMIASWLGMTVGALLGFALAKSFGRRLAKRFSSESDLELMDQVTERYGVIVLIAMRGLPILAEASVLVVGIHGLSWNRFLIPVGVANLMIAIAYTFLGFYAKENEFLPAALAISIAIPVAVTGLIKRRLNR